MWDFEAGGVDDGLTEKQNIQIDHARPFRDGALAPHFMFDSEQTREQLAREQRGFRNHHLIQEPRLIDDVTWGGLVDGRGAGKAHMRRGYVLAREQQVFNTIPQVGAERDVDGFHRRLEERALRAATPARDAEVFKATLGPDAPALRAVEKAQLHQVGFVDFFNGALLFVN